MQGWKHFIPTVQKVDYINQLLEVGFHTIDFGSFVSPKAIPQMADTKEVLQQLNLTNTTSRLLAIVANERGALDACSFDVIQYLGFPFSVSPTFQIRNTNSTQEESWKRLTSIHTLCKQHNKQLVVYLSMGFGNPYGDTYSSELLLEWAHKMAEEGIEIVSLADTVGVANPDQIFNAFSTLVPAYPNMVWGAHLHATQNFWKEKLEAAIAGGCTRMDTAILGIGGCPMAADDLVGNMATEWVLSYFEEKGISTSINTAAWQKAKIIAAKIFRN
jgi:hydroxymethylglutaryl-CoA lyase